MIVRPEAPADHAAVESLNDRAFGGPAEAAIVRALRGPGRTGNVEPIVSLVAEAETPGIETPGIEGAIVGHVLFSPVSIAGPQGHFTAMALGPMCVAPERQRRGIGSALVGAGMNACRDLGESVVFVLGHPAYYPRFGFVPASTRGLRWEREAPDEAFMVLELSRGALAGRTGIVRYHSAFDEA